MVNEILFLYLFMRFFALFERDLCRTPSNFVILGDQKICADRRLTVYPLLLRGFLGYGRPRAAASYKKPPAKTGGLGLSKNQRFFDRSRKVHTERRMSALYAFLLDFLFPILFRQAETAC